MYGKTVKSVIAKNQLALPALSQSDSRFSLSCFLFLGIQGGEFLADIIIRNLDKDTILRLDKLARKKSMSREQYLRTQLELLSYSPALKEQEERYTRLVKEVCDFIAYQTECMEKIKNDINKTL